MPIQKNLFDSMNVIWLFWNNSMHTELMKHIRVNITVLLWWYKKDNWYFRGLDANMTHASDMSNNSEKFASNGDIYP